MESFPRDNRSTALKSHISPVMSDLSINHKNIQICLSTNRNSYLKTIKKTLFEGNNISVVDNKNPEKKTIENENCSQENRNSVKEKC